MRSVLPAVVVVCGFAPGLWSQEKVNQSSLILRDFDQRLSDYQKLHKVAAAEIHGLKPTSSPEAIEHYEHKLAHEIRESRRQARQGDIFTAPISSEFRRLMNTTMQSGDAAAIRESLRHAEPVSLRTIRVNGAYPSGVPLQSTPASLLMNLPQLPQDLEYRLIDHTLIVRDVDANLIVDYLPDAFS